MATKPTKRILDWASGGTTTDPGAGKEAAGWLTADRPPAQWWNWILQSFGDWLTYFEDVTDDLPTVLAYGKVESGTTPSVIWNGSNLATPTTSGNRLDVNLSVSASSVDNLICFVTPSQASASAQADPEDVNTIGVISYDISADPTAIINLSTTTIEYSVLVIGTPA